jgi:hypothetical protein
MGSGESSAAFCGEVAGSERREVEEGTTVDFYPESIREESAIEPQLVRR